MKLSRPLIAFDVETTGVDPKKDRVVQVGVVKRYPDGRETEWVSLVNPGGPIPAISRSVHGISDADVVEAPLFEHIAGKLYRGMIDCDVCGYNVAFDIAALDAEFARCGYSSPFVGAAVLDSFRIYKRREPHTLTGAVSRYLGEKIVDAHDALADARYSLRVLRAQIKEYDLPVVPSELHAEIWRPDPGNVDVDGKFRWVGEEVVFAFGANSGKTLAQVAALDPKYLRWMLRSEFREDTLNPVKAALSGNLKLWVSENLKS